jgi:hypothetical protein
VTISLSRFRGPGDVRFGKDRPDVSREDGKVSTTAAFTVPGEYIIRVQVNDASGDGGFQCCWTNVHVKGTVKPASP